MIAPRRLFVELSKSFQFTAWKANVASQCSRRVLHSSRSNTKHARFSLPDAFIRSPPQRKVLAAFAGGSAILVLVGTQLSTQNANGQEKGNATESTSTSSELRRIRLAEVKQHNGSSERPWVTRGRSVYDITDWVGAHPGGDVILRAAGGSVDPYWDIFTIHKRQDVYDTLGQYLIGEIDPVDLVDGQVPVEAIDDPFASDPKRDSRLRIITPRPCNAETPGEGLTDFLTPNGLFYVRNHMWVPVVEEPEHRLTIELSDGEERSYTMKELKERFKHYKITATLQCAGNRRKDMTEHAKQTNGLQWTAGAISNAEWEGVKLHDVLADAGLDVENLPDDAQHAQFTGLEAYGASIPIKKAVDPYGDVLLAFKMNGEEIPRDHGFPLRVIVPGNVAARSVKWLRKVVISDEESTSQWQRRDYKCFGPNVGANPDWSKAKAIQEMPVTSAITAIHKASHSRSDTATGEEPPISVEGYAYSGGGREIVRVDISTDNGKTWDQAELLDDRLHGNKTWCWKRWRYSGLKRHNGTTTVLVKATDEAYNTQPESYGHIYNVRGNLATAWHRVNIEIGK
jgi:sulfite oxidase